MLLRYNIFKEGDIVYLLIPLFVILIILTSFYVYSFFKDNDNNNRYKTFILKLLCALIFVSIGIISYIINDNRTYLDLFLLIGLGLCACGDILLGLRRITNFHDGFFLIGTLVFIVAHVAYDTAFFINFKEDYIFMTILTIIFWGIFLVITKYTHVDFRKFQIPCYIYMLSSAIMLSIATVSLIKIASLFNIIMFIGIFLFVLSDVLLCYTYFHSKIRDSFLVKLISSYAYFLGQGLIAICIMLG